MIEQGLFLVAVMVVAVVVAWLSRNRRPDAPTQAVHLMPTQLNRADFDGAESPWLVAVFTSATCGTCADVAAKAEVLASTLVTVQRIDYTVDPALHQRYRIEAVPLVVIADHDGVVRQGFVGPVKAQDLWAAMAECREPGSTPPGCEHHD